MPEARVASRVTLQQPREQKSGCRLGECVSWISHGHLAGLQSLVVCSNTTPGCVGEGTLCMLFLSIGNERSV